MQGKYNDVNSLRLNSRLYLHHPVCPEPSLSHAKLPRFTEYVQDCPPRTDLLLTVSFMVLIGILCRKSLAKGNSAVIRRDQAVNKNTEAFPFKALLCQIEKQ